MLHILNRNFLFLYSTVLIFFISTLNHYESNYAYGQTIGFSQIQNNSITGDIQNEIDKVIGNTWSKLMDDTISITEANSKISDNNIDINDQVFLGEQNNLANLSEGEKFPDLINTKDLLQDRNNFSENIHSINISIPKIISHSITSNTVLNATGFNRDHITNDSITNNTKETIQNDTENKGENKSILLPSVYNEDDNGKSSFWNPFNYLSNYFVNLFNNPCK